jgi:hypothetical protein
MLFWALEAGERGGWFWPVFFLGRRTFPLGRSNPSSVLTFCNLGSVAVQAG